MIPEDKLSEFVRRARETSDANLEAILLFGSAVSGDFHPGLSDLNLFCVLRDSSFAALQTLAPAVKWWIRQKQPPPLCMTREELARSSDVFTIELLDMVQHHRLLYGQDVLQGLDIPTHLHRIQVEYELREKLVLLRQHLLVADGKRARLWDVLLHSAPSFATLFRHALVVLGGNWPESRSAAIQTLAKQLQFDLSSVEEVLNVREHKIDPKTLNVQDLCARYLAVIERIAGAVDGAVDEGAPAPR
ncbi:MAG TPA: nucleotidyltransferase domain-containing protein [Silvibacterium sp.]|nr:nucleotidyltransferase domain-containing protein [Silvibacterium sp.]